MHRSLFWSLLLLPLVLRVTATPPNAAAASPGGSIAELSSVSASADDGSAPPASRPDAGSSKQPEAPATKPAEPDKKYGDLVAAIETSKGTIKVELAVNAVPRLVAHFANLAERRFYDGLEFHAVSRGTQVHSGDPTGTGNGDCGYRLPKQFHKSIFFDKPGILGLWTTTDTVSSQFFITLTPMAAKYNVRQAGIGRITEGLDVAGSLKEHDKVKSVRIEGDWAKLKEDFAKELAEWNRVLDEREKGKGKEGE